MLDAVFQRFIDKSPTPVMLGGILERLFSPEKLDALFEQTAQRQYTRELFFSTLFELRIARFLRESQLPLEKNLATFDRKRLSAKLQAQLHTLLEGTFLDQAENVLAFGTPGSGKTHLLYAVGQELIYPFTHLAYKVEKAVDMERRRFWR